MADREDDEARAAVVAAASAEGPARCSGALADLAVADVVQLLQLIGKSAVMTITVAHEGGRGRLWCADGSMLDAESGRLRGEAAAYRLLSLDEGWLVAELRHEERPRTIHAPTQRLLLEAARRKDEALALKRKLGGVRCCYRLVQEPEPEQLASASAAELRLLQLLATAPSVGELLAESELGDLEALITLERWCEAGWLASVGLRPEPASSSVNAVARPLAVTSKPPLATSEPPAARASGRRRAALVAAGGALLAMASFTGGYLLRGGTAAPGPRSPAAAPHASAPPATEERLTQALEPARARDGSRDAPGAGNAVGAALAAAQPDLTEVQEPARPHEPGREGSGAAAASAMTEPAPRAGMAQARPGVSSTKPASRAEPARARSVTSRSGPSPAVSEPRVRVIGVTEPSIRLLE